MTTAPTGAWGDHRADRRLMHDGVGRGPRSAANAALAPIDRGGPDGLDGRDGHDPPQPGSAGAAPVRSASC